MDSDLIVNFWSCVRHYLDKKSVDIAAEKFVDVLADHGIDDITLKECIGNDDYLDSAIEYYLGDDDNDEWDD